MSNVSKLGVRPKVEDPTSRPTLVADENSNHPIYNNTNNANIAMQANRLSEMTEENDAFYTEENFVIFFRVRFNRKRGLKPSVIYSKNFEIRKDSI